MHIVYDKIAIDTARRSNENNTAMAYRSVIKLHDQQEFTECRDSRAPIDLASITEAAEKILKMQYIFGIFAYNGLPCGLPPCDLHF